MHLNKPDTLNSLTTVMARDFEAALQQLQADAAARVLIITGIRSSFKALSCRVQQQPKSITG
jgi:enoyl-CoA hydratase/carnithine racemase